MRRRTDKHYQVRPPFGLTDNPSPEATRRAAVALLRGEGSQDDPMRGLQLLETAAGQGSVEAARLLGRLLWSMPGRAPEGVRWLRRAADAGEGEARYLLALAHFRGQGTAQDLAAARALHFEAAERGLAEAQFELSLMLAQGLGGPVDDEGAERWEKIAAKAGHPRACLNRAARFASRDPPRFAKAVKWYERAAAAGNAEAAARLCKMHLKGEGVERDEAIARQWFDRAAELGYRWE